MARPTLSFKLSAFSLKLLIVSTVFNAQYADIIIGPGKMTELVDVGVYGIYHFLNRLMVVPF